MSRLRFSRGSLLFEMFVALAFLSIGIASMLRVFGETLFVGRSNQIRTSLKQGTDQLLFSWFANPRDVNLPEDGVLTLPLGVPETDSYWVQIQTRRLKPPTEKEQNGQAQKGQTSGFIPIVESPAQYYEADYQVMKEGARDLLNLKLVLFKMKKIGLP